MKPYPFLQILLAALIASSAHAATVTVGDDGDLTPAAGGALDGATPMVIVDYQANLYTNISGGPLSLLPTKFTFYADIGGASNTGFGQVQPFVALLTGAGTASTDYDIVAIGTNRVQDVDFFDGEVTTVDFGGDLMPIEVPEGAVLVGGIMQGTDGPGSNVVPFSNDSGLNTFITGGSAEATVDLDAEITPGGSTWSTLNGGRNYEFTIELESAAEDTDGDGLPDPWEDDNGLDKDDNGEDPNNNGVAGNPDNGASGDPDGDGLLNIDEFANGADPNDTDSDDDTLLDNDEVLGAGERPPTRPGLADTDGDTLDDLVESNTGVFVDDTDTGSDPTKLDTDGDTINDDDEVSGNNDLGFTSDPNLVDTDGDSFDDKTEIALGTDPGNAADFPSAVFIGDAAPLASLVTDLGGADTANTGNITYALQGFPYTNDSGGAEMFEIAAVNFWADADGDVTPFLSLYNDEGIGLGLNYTILAVGDPITATAGAANNAAFTVGGEEATITIEDGETVIAGFHQTAGVVPFGEPGDANADFLVGDNLIGEVGGNMVGDAGWSDLNRTYAFNVELEPGSTTPFEIISIKPDFDESSATVTWRSRTGRIYAVWASDDLQSWFELDDNITGAAGETTSYIESPLPPDARRRYYQIRIAQ